MSVRLRPPRKQPAMPLPRGRVQALPAAAPPPIAVFPPVAQILRLPRIQAERRPASFEAAMETTDSWLRRHLSFAVSLAVHLILLIALALWVVTEPGKLQQIAIVSEPVEPVVQEQDFEILAPATDVPDISEILSASAGDLTDLPEAPEVSQLPELETELADTVGFDFSPSVTQDLLMPLGGGSNGGGGSGGLGAGEDVGELMQFVERLQKAGAKSGDVQISLIWDNFNDLDLHVITPRGENIFFGHRRSRCRGELDVDMNAGAGKTREPVENVYWGKGKAPTGKYKVAVHHYRNHGDPDPTHYELRVVVDGQTKVIQGELEYGSPRMIVYEFERSALSPPPVTRSAATTARPGFRIIRAEP